MENTNIEVLKETIKDLNAQIEKSKRIIDLLNEGISLSKKHPQKDEVRYEYIKEIVATIFLLSFWSIIVYVIVKLIDRI